jgi:acyl dehydratase
MEALAGGAPAWDGLATLLSRALAQRAPAAPRPVGPEAPGGWSEPLVVDVPASTGRRYARASGDYNPFHLHALLARPFGFPRAIAHGMWTLAWALAHLRDPLPDAHTVEATFRKPVLMPARIALRDRTTAAGREVEVRDAAEDLLHLSAALR